MKKSFMTHPERADRRKRIVAYCEDGHSIEEAAKRFSVALETVKAACRVGGYEYRIQGSRTGPKTYDIIAKIQQGGSLSEIAREFKVTRSWVSLIKRDCERAGVKL